MEAEICGSLFVELTNCEWQIYIYDIVSSHAAEHRVAALWSLSLVCDPTVYQLDALLIGSVSTLRRCSDIQNPPLLKL